MVFLRAGIVLLLLILFYQDLKFKAVAVWLFPLIAICLILLRYFQNQSILTIDPAINVGLLMGQLLLVSAYFSIKQKRFVNITQELLGWGDILFLVCIAFYLAPLNYFMFYLCSLTVVIVAWLLLTVVKRQGKQIPLAGLQALLFTVVFVAEWTMPGLQLTADEWLLTRLM